MSEILHMSSVTEANPKAKLPLTRREIKQHLKVFTLKPRQAKDPWHFNDSTRHSSRHIEYAIRDDWRTDSGTNPENQNRRLVDLTDSERETYLRVKERLKALAVEKLSTESQSSPKSHILITDRYIRDRVQQTYSDLSSRDDQGIPYEITGRQIRNIRKALKHEMTRQRDSSTSNIPAQYFGFEEELYKEAKRRIEVDLSRIEQKGAELPLPEQMQLAKNAVRKVINPRNILTNKGRQQTVRDLVDLGYTQEMAKKTAIHLTASAVGMAVSFGFNEAFTHLAMYIGYRSGIEIGSLSDPYTLALLGATYDLYLKSTIALFRTHSEMIKRHNMTSNLPAVAANAVTKPLITHKINGEQITDVSIQNKILQGSYLGPQLINEIYYGAIGFAAPNLYIIANITGILYKNLERLALEGLDKNAEVIAHTIKRTKETTRRVINKVRNSKSSNIRIDSIHSSSTNETVN